jgi:hypothetical protein
MMTDLPGDVPRETPDRDDYYDAALIDIILWCQSCRTTLDPDRDLGPQHNFHTPYYFILLGDEAYRRGWSIVRDGDGFRIFCPTCAQS